MLKKYENKSNFSHFYQILKISFIITIKKITEYKFNFYNGILTQIIHTIFPLIFGKVIINHFGNIINWNFYDYIIFYYFQNLIIVIVGMFSWDKKINQNIKSGNLNKYLYRPKNQFFNFYTNLNSNVIIYLTFNIIFILPIIIYYTNFNFLAIIISYIISIIIIITYLSIIYFIESLNFYLLNISFYIRKPLKELENTFRTYPGNFFQNNSIIKILSLIVPIYLIGIIIVPLYKEIIFLKIIKSILICILITIIFGILTHINWKYGLKKYEAFG